MRTEGMPRRASWAAMMVPEKPPPTIATGTSRSDLIIWPVFRVRGAGLARLDVVVDAGHRLAARFGEPAGHCGVNEHRQPRANQLAADLHRADAVARPGHTERAWMLDKHPMKNARLTRLADGLLAGHDPSLFKRCGDPGAIRTRGPQIRNLMLYPAELRGLEPTNRDSRAGDQFTWFGGTTGSGSGATGTPSSTSDFACSSVALPWTCSRSISPLCIARAVSAKRSPTHRESLSSSAWTAAMRASG